MPFCNACGTEIPADSAFCWKCGNRMNAEVLKDAASRNPVKRDEVKVADSKVQKIEKPALDLNPELREMSLKESIEFADRLIKAYKDFEKAQQEADDLESSINRPITSTSTTGNFDLGFLRTLIIISVIAYNVMGFIGFGIGGYEGLAKACWIGLAVLAGLWALGIIYLIYKKKKTDRVYADAVRKGKDKKQADRRKLAELKENLSKLEANLRKTDEMIPPHMRNSACMGKTKVFLVSGKASNMYEALEMIP